MGKTKVVATRITEPLSNAIDIYLQRDTHVSSADFLRDAIREKISRDTPDLYKQIFQRRR